MIDLVGIAGAYLVKPKILHSIPGRLRIAVPGLSKLSPFLLNSLSELDLTDIGVLSVAASGYTGNILITYDVRKIREAEILSALTTLALTFVRYRGRFQGMPEDRLPALVGDILRRVEDKSVLLEGKEMVLPDDIWQ